VNLTPRRGGVNRGLADVIISIAASKNEEKFQKVKTETGSLSDQKSATLWRELISCKFSIEKP
jgi:hypothetical protein